MLLVFYTAKCQMISWIVSIEVEESLTCPLSNVWQSGLNKLNWIVLNVEGSSHAVMWFFSGIYVEGVSRPMKNVSWYYRQSLGRNLNWGSSEYQAKVLPTPLCYPVCCSLNVERWNIMMTMTGSLSSDLGESCLYVTFCITSKHICAFGGTSTVTVMQIPFGVMELEFVYWYLLCIVYGNESVTNQLFQQKITIKWMSWLTLH